MTSARVGLRRISVGGVFVWDVFLDVLGKGGIPPETSGMQCWGVPANSLEVNG